MQLITGHTLVQRKCSKESTFISFLSANTGNYNQLCTPAAPKLPVLLSFLQSPDLSHISRAPSCNFTFRLPLRATPGRGESSFHQHHLQLISSGIPSFLGEPSSQVQLLLGDYFKGRDSSSHTITSLSFLKSSGLRASVLQDTMCFPFPCKESLIIGDDCGVYPAPSQFSPG